MQEFFYIYIERVYIYYYAFVYLLHVINQHPEMDKRDAVRHSISPSSSQDHI